MHSNVVILGFASIVLSVLLVLSFYGGFSSGGANFCTADSRFQNSSGLVVICVRVFSVFLTTSFALLIAFAVIANRPILKLLVSYKSRTLGLLQESVYVKHTPNHHFHSVYCTK